MTTARRSPRWAVLDAIDIGTEGDPYLDRLRILQTPYFCLYLHHIHRADTERDPHDHPWSFASLVLAGGYEEDVWPRKEDSASWAARSRPRWSLRTIRQHQAHAITSVTGPLWTLVLTGPRRADWGFWRDGTFTHWKDYQVSPVQGTRGRSW